MIYAGTVVTIKHYKPIGSRTIAIDTDLEHVRRLIEGNYGTRHPIPIKEETMGVPHPLLAQRARNSSSVENCLVLT